MSAVLQSRPASYAESSARERLRALVDPGTFHEWLGPAERLMSPHLAALGVPAAFDDGVIVGQARLSGHDVFIAAQEGAFMGGGVGEVHGAKITGLLKRALRERPQAVLLLAESGGVRLQEANAGLIAVSEIMRAVLDARAAGIPVITLIGGANGCFGGMGIVARCTDHVVMSEVGRLSLSGPEVIEASHGVDEFDSRDRALVWRTTGGRHRRDTGDCDVLVDDDVAAFRAAVIDIVVSDNACRPITTESMAAEHALIQARVAEHPAEPAAHDATGDAPAGGPGVSGQLQRLVETLFGSGHDVRTTGSFLHGTADFVGTSMTVIGTTNHAPMDIETALAHARCVLDTVASHPGRPILMLIDTEGQQLRRRDELLGINRAMAHLAMSIDVARRASHPVVALIYDQALSGGFIATGLMADACDALPDAEIRVMRIPAMARVTKLPEDVLTRLAQTNPVFAPGVGNYVAMGGVRRLWEGDLRACLKHALTCAGQVDTRSADGAARGGRLLAASVAQQVIDAH